MRDRLRQLANRPLHDSERRRLFAIAAALIIVAAGLLALLDDDAPTPNRSHDTGAAASAAPSTPTDPAVPATTPVTVSEDSDLPAELRPAANDVARSKRAARGFLHDYLPFTYGHGHAADIRFASPELRAQLTHTVPRVSSRERARRPRLELLQSNGVTHVHADLTALVNDGARRYSIHLQLANTPTGWLVTSLDG